MAGGDPRPDGAVVVGVHRSGTSLATKLLDVLGLATCVEEDLLRASPANPKGFFESRTLIGVNNDLLASTGARWWRPPTAERRDAVAGALDDAGATHLARVFADLHPVRPWVWKDPRLCVTLPWWRTALGDGVVGVFVNRHPLGVADSLTRRNSIPADVGVALWVRYTRLALPALAGRPVAVSDTGAIAADPVGWTRVVGGFLTRHGIPVDGSPSAERIRSFVDPSLLADVPDGGTGGAVDPALLDEAMDLHALLGGMLGAHDRFAPPALGTEGPSVAATLDALPLDWPAGWTRPTPFRRPLRVRITDRLPFGPGRGTRPGPVPGSSSGRS